MSEKEKKREQEHKQTLRPIPRGCAEPEFQPPLRRSKIRIVLAPRLVADGPIFILCPPSSVCIVPAPRTPPWALQPLGRPARRRRHPTAEAVIDSERPHRYGKEHPIDTLGSGESCNGPLTTCGEQSR